MPTHNHDCTLPGRVCESDPPMPTEPLDVGEIRKYLAAGIREHKRHPNRSCEHFSCYDAQVLQAHVATLEAQVKALRESVRVFGRHKAGCAVLWRHGPPQACGCGLDAALRAQEAGRG